MKKVLKGSAAIIMAASALSLTGCGKKYGTDLPKEYKAFFDYSFGGDQSFEITEQGIENEDYDEAKYGYTKYKVSYTGYKGVKTENDLTSHTVREDEREYYRSQKAKDNIVVFDFITDCIGKKAEDEFADAILSKYCTLERVDDSDIYNWKSDDISALIAFYPPIGMVFNGEEKLLNELISDKTGYSVKDSDLKAVAQDDKMKCMIMLKFPEGSDESECIDIIKAVQADFEEYTENPMNYIISMKIDKPDEDGKVTSQTVYREEYVMGRKFDKEASGIPMTKAILNELSEIYDFPYETDDSIE